MHVLTHPMDIHIVSVACGGLVGVTFITSSSWVVRLTAGVDVTLAAQGGESSPDDIVPVHPC